MSEIIITYRNDFVFKKTLASDDEDSRYVLVDQYGKELKYNLITYHIVSIPYIQEILAQRKGELSDLEVLCYVYEYGVDDDIMKMLNPKQKKVLEIMKSKLEMVMENEEQYGYVVSAEYFDVEKEVSYDNGVKYGIKQGQELGLAEGMIETLTKQIQLKYDVDAREWIKILNKEQFEKVQEYILFEEDFQELKSKVIIDDQ